jgi:glutathione synthase/RimK-type ligase-like ATP-grasp enzyme
VRIAIATFEGMPPRFGDDDRLLVRKLRERGVEVDYAPWTDPDADWHAPDLVHARSPWDYALRHGEFIEWVESVRALENDPGLIAWNSDKRYLADLHEAGIPVVETTYVEPGGAVPPIEAEVVVKPTVSAGGRDTGRFGPRSAEAGRGLIERITGRGGTAMVQPFVESVDSAGETAVVTIAGEVSHVLHKRPVLRADEVAPVREDDLRVAEAMYDPGLVTPGEADEDELELTARVVELIERRFGSAPLIARVDMLRHDGGHPIVLELEAIEPNLYFDQVPEAADQLADALVARAAARTR